MALHVNQNGVSCFPLSSITLPPPQSHMRTNDVPLTGEDIAKWRCHCKMPPMWNEQPGHAHLAEVLLNNSISPRSSLLMQRFLLLSTIWFTKKVLAIYMGCGAAVPMGRRRRRFTITHMGERQCNSRTSDSDENCCFQICANLKMRKWKGPEWNTHDF